MKRPKSNRVPRSVVLTPGTPIPPDLVHLVPREKRVLVTLYDVQREFDVVRARAEKLLSNPNLGTQQALGLREDLSNTSKRLAKAKNQCGMRGDPPPITDEERRRVQAGMGLL